MNPWFAYWLPWLGADTSLFHYIIYVLLVLCSLVTAQLSSDSLCRFVTDPRDLQIANSPAHLVTKNKHTLTELKFSAPNYWQYPEAAAWVDYHATATHIDGKGYLHIDNANGKPGKFVYIVRWQRYPGVKKKVLTTYFYLFNGDKCYTPWDWNHNKIYSIQVQEIANGKPQWSLRRQWLYQSHKYGVLVY